MQPNSIVSAPEAFRLLNETGLKLSRAQFYTLIKKNHLQTVMIPGNKRYFFRRADLDRIAQPVAVAGVA
jgi:hypothetical protein